MRRYVDCIQGCRVEGADGKKNVNLRDSRSIYQQNLLPFRTKK